MHSGAWWWFHSTKNCKFVRGGGQILFNPEIRITSRHVKWKQYMPILSDYYLPNEFIVVFTVLQPCGS